MIRVLQKRIGHEPDQWEDLAPPAVNSRDVIGCVAKQFRDLKMEATYRIILDTGEEATFQVYRREIYELRINGVVQDED